MPAIVSIAQLKGGVGKTTICVNLVRALAKAGKKILVIDADYQAHTSKWLTGEKIEAAACLSRKFYEGQTPSPQAVTENIHLIAGDMLLQKTDKLSNLEDLEKISEVIAACGASYDLVLMDTHPSPNTCTYNTLVAAQGVLIPITLSKLAIWGANDLLSIIASVRKRLNPHLKIYGFVLNMCDGRPRISRQLAAAAAETFNKLMFNTAIPRSCRTEEAINRDLSVMEVEPESKIARCFTAFVNEFHERVFGYPLPMEPVSAADAAGEAAGQGGGDAAHAASTATPKSEDIKAVA